MTELMQDSPTIYYKLVPLEPETSGTIPKLEPPTIDDKVFVDDVDIPYPRGETGAGGESES